MKVRSSQKNFGVAPAKDVGILIDRALTRPSYFRNRNEIVNEAVRAFLMPKYGKGLRKEVEAA
jgi:hypothetical protein